MKPTLSILVPTYQRCHHLALLLNELELQLESLPQSFAEVVVSDNCSEDATQLVATAYTSRNASWSYIRKDVNVGPDENFISLIDAALGSYFWVLGDDDLPRRGFLHRLASVLASESPSLFFLPPLGCTTVDPLATPLLDELIVASYTPFDFLRKVNHLITFMSCWIVNNEELRRMDLPPGHFRDEIGTNLIQLSWCMPLILKSDAKLIVANDVCILATMGNSGNYNVLTTFCLNYPDFVRRHSLSCASLSGASISRAMIAPYVRSGLPGLIFAVRNGSYRKPGQNKSIIIQSIKRYWPYLWFWLLCMPAFLIPLFLLRALVFTARNLRVRLAR